MGIFDLFKGKRETALRVNWDDTEDIGIVTHYKDKPLTGIAYGLHDNGSISEEVEMLDGLKHGQGVDYNEESNITQTTIYENDLIVDFDEDTWNCLLDDIFQKDNYEYELIDMTIYNYDITQKVSCNFGFLFTEFESISHWTDHTLTDFSVLQCTIQYKLY